MDDQRDHNGPSANAALVARDADGFFHQEGSSPCLAALKRDAVDPLTYFTATLTAIINGHRQSRIDKLLPGNYPGMASNFHT